MGFLDLFKPDWKHSNPEIRKKALLREKNTAILIEALNEETNTTVVAALVDKLTSIETLEEIHNKVSGHAAELLAQKLADEYFSITLKASSMADTRFEKLDEKQLCRIAREALHENIQLTAIDHLNCEDSLSSVIQGAEKKLAQHALEKLTSRQILRKLVKGARYKSTRALARKRYDQLYGEAERAQARHEDGRRKLEKVLEVLEGMSTLSDWAELLDDYQDQLKRWQSFSEFADNELNDRYKEACAECISRKALFEKEQVKKLEKKRLLDEKIFKRRKLLQNLLEDTEKLQNNSLELLADYKGHWEAIGSLEDEEERQLAKKFDSAIKSFDAKQEVLKSLHAQKQEVSKELAAIGAETSALQNSASDGKSNTSAVVKSLYKRLNDITPEYQKILHEEYTKALSSLEKISHQLTEHRAQEAEAQKLLLAEYNKILTTVSGLQESSKKNTEMVKDFQKQWKELSTLSEKEQKKLDKQFHKACDAYFDKVKEYVKNKQWCEFANLSAKETLIKQMAALENIQNPRELAKQIKRLQEEWKLIDHTPHSKSDELWERFSGTADKLYERCKVYFEEQHKLRQENLAIKKTILAEAQTLSESNDWKLSAQKLKELQSKWKETGPGPRKKDQQAWEEFREACNRFFERRKKFFAELESQKPANTAKKEALLVAIKEAAQNEILHEAAAKIKDLQKKWKEVGPAIRDKENELWEEFRKTADDFFNRRKKSYQQAQNKTKENVAVKLKLIEKIEAQTDGLDESSDWTALAPTFKQAQKDFYKMPDAGEQDKSLKNRLRAACDKFFAARKAHYDKLTEQERENLEKKEEFCLKIELMAESREWQEATEEFKKFPAEFKKLPAINDKYDAIMFRRFHKIYADCFEGQKEPSEESDDIRHENLQKKIALCQRIEEIAGLEFDRSEGNEVEISIADMAAELQSAFNNNSGGYEEQSVKPLSFRTASQEVRELQVTWKETGAVPSAKAQSIWERFHKALDSFYHQRQEFYNSRQKNLQRHLETKKKLLAKLKKEASREKVDMRQVKELQREWRHTGEVAAQFFRDLSDEYRALCDKLYKNNKSTEKLPTDDSRI